MRRPYASVAFGLTITGFEEDTVDLRTHMSPIGCPVTGFIPCAALVYGGKIYVFLKIVLLNMDPFKLPDGWFGSLSSANEYSYMPGIGFPD
jgi:hypothetical protein